MAAQCQPRPYYSPDMAMLFSAFGRTHPPPPFLSFKFGHNLSPKEITTSDILRLKSHAAYKQLGQ